MLHFKPVKIADTLRHHPIAALLALMSSVAIQTTSQAAPVGLGVEFQDINMNVAFTSSYVNDDGTGAWYPTSSVEMYAQGEFYSNGSFIANDVYFISALGLTGDGYGSCQHYLCNATLSLLDYSSHFPSDSAYVNVNGLTGEVFVSIDPTFATFPVYTYDYFFMATSYTDNVELDYYSGGTRTFTVTNPNSVPEPATWALLLLGFAGVGFAGYQRARAA